MQIASSAEAGAIVRLLRQQHGITRKELSECPGIPLRTVYAVENGELNNLSVDRLVSLLTALGRSLDVRVSTTDAAEATSRYTKCAM